MFVVSVDSEGCDNYEESLPDDPVEFELRMQARRDRKAAEEQKKQSDEIAKEMRLKREQDGEYYTDFLDSINRAEQETRSYRWWALFAMWFTIGVAVAHIMAITLFYCLR